MEELVERWAPTFARLGDPTRLRLLLMMHHRGPAQATVGELAEATGVSPGTASAALTLMAKTGIIARTTRGREARYALVDPDTHQLLHSIGGGHDSESPERS